ncbi:hypothetical protein E2C01_084956 [Portunus trituberculatus]|uniref:Uncharacterized protein n=1 Tax=Portunus trituberculatus TaxID=210409 RepID=A0A5B7IZN6_PORTR|nr:hypothetical protein [Portunus trituberculatus]
MQVIGGEARPSRQPEALRRAPLVRHATLRSLPCVNGHDPFTVVPIWNTSRQDCLLGSALELLLAPSCCRQLTPLGPFISRVSLFTSA